MRKRHVIALIVLVPCALFWSLAAYYGRADTLDEVNSGKFTDWITLGPLWAGITYTVTSAALRAYHWKRPIAVGAALVIWVTVALTANWWEDKKVEMRMQHFRQNAN